MLVLVLYLLLKLRLNFFRIIIRNKEVLFMMIFAIVLGVMVGVSSYNYGALSRYKMPAQMFFVIAIILILDKTDHQNKRNIKY